MSPRKSASDNDPQLTRGTGKPSFLYRQLADLLRKEIESGGLKPGDMLPSMDDLAEKYNINKATVRQAIADLMSSGMVFSVPAKGTFVSDPSQHRTAATKRLSIGWISTVGDSGNTGRYHTEIMDAVREHVQALGGHLLVFSAAKMTTSNFYNAIGEANLDGAVVVGPPKEDPMKRIILSDLPVVMLDDRLRSRRIDSIMVDNEGGGYQAVEHLASLGHKRFAFVSGPHSWGVCQDRLNGALNALKDAGFDESAATIIESDFTPDGGRQSARRILGLNPRPTGIFFFNDEMAAGALQTFYELSDIHVPRDMSVVGFDDISWAQLAHPQLTTIHVEKEIMGREAVEHLYRSITDNNHLPTTMIVPTRLVVRKSTGAPPP
jgi:LacI family transcriptional regulator